MRQHIDQLRLDDGTMVSYAVTGSGPPLVYLPGWVSHLELGWALPAERLFYEALGEGRTLIRYDRPGCGLSGPAPDDDLAATEMRVLAALWATVGLERADLLGTSLSAPLAVLWAAQHPDTVARLVLYGGWAAGDRLATAELRENVLGLVEHHWGLGADVLTDIFAPGADGAVREAFAAHQRMSASAETARHALATGYTLDVSESLAAIQAPTTVVHRKDDRAVPLSEGEGLAQGIPGASLTVIPGRAHLPFVGDVDLLVNAIRAGLELPPLARAAVPSLTARQLEVAALVSQGLSNRHIAERLVISERSAESHIERIRDRLGFRSRAQIAAWYVTTTASKAQIPSS